MRLGSVLVTNQNEKGPLPSTYPLHRLGMGRFGLSGKTGFDDTGPEIFTIERGDETDADAFWTDGFTLILIAARTESFSIHGFQHRFHPTGTLGLPLRQERQVRHFGRHKQHGRSIFTCRYTGSTADTGRGIHRGFGLVFTD